jgi:ribosome modulation factor
VGKAGSMTPEKLDSHGSITLEQAYDFGFDCGLHGASAKNCDFKIFAIEKTSNAWHKGNQDGLQKRGITNETAKEKR